jgi:signal transduction histidine kinase
VNASFQTHANTRKVALSLNMPDVPVWASGLELALKQVFMIPISLAVFSSKQGSHITVALESQENAAIFSVSTDDANGIPADLSQVGHYSSIPEHPGLHSGMWLVLGLVQQLEGQCDFGRFDKHIQTIRIKLPLAMV